METRIHLFHLQQRITPSSINDTHTAIHIHVPRFPPTATDTKDRPPSRKRRHHDMLCALVVFRAPSMNSTSVFNVFVGSEKGYVVDPKCDVVSVHLRQTLAPSTLAEKAEFRRRFSENPADFRKDKASIGIAWRTCPVRKRKYANSLP